jgi:hypothetical protein
MRLQGVTEEATMTEEATNTDHVDLLFTTELKAGSTYVVVVPDDGICEQSFMDAIKHIATSAECRVFVVESAYFKEVESESLFWYHRGYNDAKAKVPARFPEE